MFDPELDPETMTIEVALFGLPDKTKDYLAEILFMEPDQIHRELGRATHDEQASLSLLGITAVTDGLFGLTDFGKEIAFAAATAPRGGR